MSVPLRLLIVEDSEDDALLILRDIRRAGFEPTYARVDSEAHIREALRTRQWDVVLSDFSMPHLSGRDALKLVREHDPDVPFIFVSGTIGEDVAVEAMRAGAQDYVRKGDLRRLVPAIERELRESAVRRERHRIEAQLRAREEYYRTILENIGDAVFIFDGDGRILDVNPRGCELTGYSRDELVGMSVVDTYPPEDRPTGARRVASTNAGESTIAERRLLRKDGKILNLETNARRLPDGRLLGTARDITERHRAERMQTALYHIAHAAHTAADLQELLRAVHEIVETLMPARSFYIALYDEAADQITFPYFVDEQDPPPPPRKPGRGITDHVLRTGEPLLVTPGMTIEGEESYGTPSHYWLGVPLKARGRAIGVLAVQTYTPGVQYEEGDKEILQFVSTQIATAIERKRAEETLRHREERFRALVERSGDAVALLDRGGTISYASASTKQVLGREPESILATSAFDLLHPEDVTEVRRTLAGLRGRAGTVMPVRSRFMHGDGTWHEGEGTVTNRLDDPAVQAIVFNYRDVTDRTKLETQLRQAQKMEAIGRLAGGVAHDFNNVLTAVFGYVDLLREELPQESRGYEDLVQIRKAAERAAGLTKQLLAFSRQQVLEPVVLRPNELIEDFEKMLRRVIGEDIALRLTLAQDVGNVRADPGQLHQVVMNLVVNARDAMPPPAGGSIIIETANAHLSEQYAEMHQPVVPGPYVMLAVSDTGTGMTPEVKARIFEPFFTTKEKGKGTGLGLSTVYGIVKQSGGYIWVYSEVGRGTTFKIYLPRVDAPAERVAKPKEAGALAGNETILLAEDDAILRPLARSLLEKLGYTVLEAENAETALAAERAHSGPLHLLVADVVMPGTSGRELARQLAESRPHTRVLYMSGYTDDAIVHHGMLEPGLNFLQKPFTPATLARKVRDVLDAK